MKKYLIWYINVLLLLLPAISNAQFKIPPKPEKQTSVYDLAGLLNKTDEKALAEKLLYYADSTSNQIIVVTTKTIKGENIGLLTPKWAHEWGVGQEEKDNGVFILLAEKERSIWISPGYGVEDRLTAGQVGEITRNIIIPEFKAGSYYNGLDKGTDEIINLIGTKYVEERSFKDVPYREAEAKESESLMIGFITIGVILALFVGFILLLIWVVKNGGKKQTYSYRPSSENIAAAVGTGITFSKFLKSLDTPPLKSNYSPTSTTYTSSGSSSGRSRSSSGFGGGFGGGGFSGGGAGGSW